MHPRAHGMLRSRHRTWKTARRDSHSLSTLRFVSRRAVLAGGVWFLLVFGISLVFLPHFWHRFSALLSVWIASQSCLDKIPTPIRSSSSSSDHLVSWNQIKETSRQFGCFSASSPHMISEKHSIVYAFMDLSAPRASVDQFQLLIYSKERQGTSVMFDQKESNPRTRIEVMLEVDPGDEFVIKLECCSRDKEYEKQVQFSFMSLEDLHDCKVLGHPLLFASFHESKRIILWESSCLSGVRLEALRPQHSPLFGPVKSFLLGQNRFVHQAEISLQSTFSFQVFSGQASSQEYVLQTPDSKGRFLLGIVSDSQYGTATFRHVLQELAGSKVHGILHAGDFVHDPWNFQEWETYWKSPFETQLIGSRVPIYPVRGNHDNGAPFSQVFAPFPGIKSWYTFQSHGLKVLVLDATASVLEQTRWLRNELSNSASRNACWRIVAVHVPPFIEYWDPKVYSENEQWIHVRTQWVPLFEELGVDAVISGHSHLYQSGSYNSIQYFIFGGGGGALETEKAYDWKGLYTKTRLEHHFGTMEVDEDVLKISAQNLQGETIDSKSLACNRI